MNLSKIPDLKAVICDPDQLDSYLVFPENSVVQNISAALCRLDTTNNTELNAKILQHLNFSSFIRAMKLVEEFKELGGSKTNLSYLLEEVAQMYDVVRNTEAFSRAVLAFFSIADISELIGQVPLLIKDISILKNIIDFFQKVVISLNPIMDKIAMKSTVWTTLKNVAELGGYLNEISEGSWSRSTAEFMEPLAVVINSLLQLSSDNSSKTAFTLLNILSDFDWLSLYNSGTSSGTGSSSFDNTTLLNNLNEIIEHGPNLTKALVEAVLNNNIVELEILISNIFSTVDLNNSVNGAVYTSVRNLLAVFQNINNMQPPSSSSMAQIFTPFISTLNSVLPVTSFSISTLCSVVTNLFAQTDQNIQQTLFTVIGVMDTLADVTKLLPELDDLTCILFDELGLNVAGFWDKLTELGSWNIFVKAVEQFSNPTKTLSCLLPVQDSLIIIKNLNDTFVNGGLNISKIMHCLNSSSKHIPILLTNIKSYLLAAKDVINLLQKTSVQKLLTDPELLPLFDLLLDFVVYNSKDHELPTVSSLLKAELNVTNFLLNMNVSQIIVNTFLGAVVNYNETGLFQQPVHDIVNMLCDPVKLSRSISVSHNSSVSISSALCNSQVNFTSEYLKNCSSFFGDIATSSIGELLNLLVSLLNNYSDVIKFSLNILFNINLNILNYNVDVLDRVLKYNTFTDLFSLLQKLLKEAFSIFPPKYKTETVFNSLQTVLYGLMDLDILKGYLLHEIQVKFLLKNPENTTEYYVNNFGFTQNVSEQILNAAFSSHMLLRTANYSNYVCEEVTKRLLFINISKATLQNVINEVCALNFSNLTKLLDVLAPTLDVNALLSKYTTNVAGVLYESTNMSNDELTDLANKIDRGVAISLTAYNILNQSQSGVDILENIAEASTSAFSMEKLSQAICGRAVSDLTSIPSIMGISFSSSGDITDKLQTTQNENSESDLPGQFCQDLYKSVNDLGFGSILWTYLKPIMRGKILYTPDNDFTRAILTKANKTFAAIDDINKFALYWAERALNLQVLQDLIQEPNQLKDVLNNGFVQDIIKSTTGIQPDFLLSSLSAIDNSTLNTDNLKTLQSIFETVSNYTSCILADRFQPVANETELENMAYQLTKSKTFFAGIVFYNVNNGSNNSTRAKRQVSGNTLPKHVGYKIRMDVDNVMDTNLLKERIFSMNSESSFIENLRYLRGFMFLQDMLDSAIIELHKNQSIPTPGINLIQMPFPCHHVDNFIFLLGTYLVPIMMTFVLLTLLGVATHTSVNDRENGQDEILHVMGMLKGLNFIAWFIMTMFMMGLVSIILAVMLKHTSIFIHSDLFIMFLLLLGFCLSSLMLLYMVASFFSRTSMAILFVMIVYFMAYLPFTIIIGYDFTLKFWQRILTSLASTSSFCFATLRIAFFEEEGIGVQWSNINEAVNEEVSVAWSFYMMLIDSVIYFLIGWYIQHLKPGKYGIGHPFFFPFQPSYWRSFFKHRLPSGEMIGNESQTEATGILFDAPPDNFIVGIAVQNIVKIYSNKKKAIDNLSINFYENEITALLGHNGAAKTTLILLKEVDLWHARNIPAKNLSYGMKRRLCVALAFVGSTRTIILDEPTSGIDPYTRKHIWNLITRNRKGRTILLSTHHLDEADFLSDRIGVMHQGKLICFGSPSFLKRSVEGGYSLTVVKKEQSLAGQHHENSDHGSGSVDAAILSFIQTYSPKATLVEQVGDDLTFNLPKDNSLLIPIDQFFKRLEQSAEQLNVASYGLSDTTLEELTKTADEALNLSSDAQQNEDQNSAEVEEIQSGLSDSLFDETHRRVGVALKFAQIGALFLKRCHHYRRNWRIIFSAVLMPMVFFLLALAYSSIRDSAKSPMSDKCVHELTETSSGYGIACMKDWQQNYFRNENCVGSSPWYNRSLPLYNVQCLNSLQSYTLLFTNYWIPEKHIQADSFIQDLNEKNISSHLINTFKDYREKRFGGWSFEPSDNNESFDPFVWFNTKGYHSMPSYYNALTNTLLRFSLPADENPAEYGITAVNHPIRLIRAPLTLKTLTNDAADAGLSLMIVVAFSLIPSSFILYIINENVMKERQLQNISGINAITYWSVAYAWDMLAYCFTLSLAVICILIFKPDSYYLKENFAGFTVIVLLYGWSVIPCNYCLSHFFTKGSTAYLVTFCICLFLALGTVISLLVILLFGDTYPMPTIYKVCRYLFLIFPQFCMGQGLTDMTTNTIVYKIFMRYNDDKFKSPFGADILGWKILAMAIEGIIFFILILIIDSVKFPALSLHQDSSTQNETEESDVRREKERIEQGLANDLLVVDSLSKVYRRKGGKFFAVNHVSFGVPEGACFGLLGVNGAGKTTIFRMLTGDCLPSSGSVNLKGKRLSKRDRNFGQNVGYCPQEGGLDEYLTAEEMLYFHARLRGFHSSETKSLVANLLDQVRLTQYAHHAIHTYSGGTKRKLALAVALLGSPPILYLDEPTSGMDAATRRLAWQCIARANSNGQSVVLTSHSMDECDALCSTIAIMVNGEIKCIGSPQHLKQKYGDGYTVVIHKGEKLLSDLSSEFINKFPASAIKVNHHSSVEFQVPTSTYSVADILAFLQLAQDMKSIDYYSLTQTTLDSVFISFAQEQSDDSFRKKISSQRTVSSFASLETDSSFISGHLNISTSSDVASDDPGFVNPAVLSPAFLYNKRNYAQNIKLGSQRYVKHRGQKSPNFLFGLGEGGEWSGLEIGRILFSDVHYINMSLVRQFMFLVWKNILFRRSHPGVVVLELVWPVIVIGIVSIMRTGVPAVKFKDCYYQARAMPSAGLVPFLQTFVCNLDNHCFAKEEKLVASELFTKNLAAMTNDLSSIFASNESLNLLTLFNNSNGVIHLVKTVIKNKEVLEKIENMTYLQYYLRNVTQVKVMLVNELKLLTAYEASDLSMSKFNLAKVLNVTSFTNLTGIICDPSKLKSFILFPNISNIVNISNSLCTINMSETAELSNKFIAQLNLSSIIRVVQLIEEIKEVFVSNGSLSFVFDDVAKMTDVLMNSELALGVIAKIATFPGLSEVIQKLPAWIDIFYQFINVAPSLKNTISSLKPLLLVAGLDTSQIWSLMENFITLGENLNKVKEGSWYESTEKFLEPIKAIFQNVKSLSADDLGQTTLTLLELASSLSQLAKNRTLSSKAIINSVNLLQKTLETQPSWPMLKEGANFISQGLALTNTFTKTFVDINQKLQNLIETNLSLATSIDQVSEKYPAIIQSFVQMITDPNILAALIVSGNLENTVCETLFSKLAVNFNDSDVKSIGDVFCTKSLTEALSELTTRLNLTELTDNINQINSLIQTTVNGTFYDQPANFTKIYLQLSEIVSTLQSSLNISTDVFSNGTDNQGDTNILSTILNTDFLSIDIFSSVSDVIYFFQLPFIQEILNSPEVTELAEFVLNIIRFSNEGILFVSDLFKRNVNISDYLINVMGLPNIVTDNFLNAKVNYNETYFLQHSVPDILNIFCNPDKLSVIISLPLNSPVSIANISSYLCNSQVNITAEYLKNSSENSSVIGELQSKSTNNITNDLIDLLSYSMEFFTKFSDVTKFITAILSNDIPSFLKNNIYVVDKLLVNSNFTEMAESLQVMVDILAKINPFDSNAIRIYTDAQKIINGLKGLDIIKEYFLQQFQVKSMVKLSDNMTNYLMTNFGFSEETTQGLLNAFISTSLLLADFNHSEHSCVAVMNRLMFINVTKVLIESITNEVCRLNSTQLEKLSNAFPMHIEIFSLINTYLANTVQSILQSTNFSNDQLIDQANDIERGLTNMINAYDIVIQAQDKNIILKYFYDAAISGTLNSDSVTKGFCGRTTDDIFSFPPTPGVSFASQENLLDKFQQETSEVIEDELPGQFCMDVYRSIKTSDFGTIIWSFFKPLWRGRILYTPDNDITRAIISKGILNFEFVQEMIASLGIQVDSLLSRYTENKNNSFSADYLKLLQSAAEFISNYSSCIQTNRFQPVSNESVLQETAYQLSKTNMFFAGIVFFNTSDVAADSSNRSRRDAGRIAITKQLGYRLRMDVDNVMTTDYLKLPIEYMTSEANFIEEMRYLRGFIYLQDMLDNAIIDLHKNQSLTTPGIFIKQTPFPCHHSDSLVYIIGSYFVPIMMIIVFVAILAVATNILVYDKEGGQEEALHVMGMMKGLNSLAWFFCTMFIMSIISIIIAVMLKWTQVFFYTDLSILFLLLWFFCLSSVILVYTVSAFFNRTSMAILFVLIVFLMTFLPYTLVIGLEMNMKLQHRLLASLASTTAFCFGSLKLANFEASGFGVQWVNINQADGENMSVAWSFGMMVIDSAIYLLIGWYVRQIKPGKYGIGQPLYFPFKLSYWRSCFVNRPMDCAIPNTQPIMTGTLFEPAHANAQIGIAVDNISKIYSHKKKALDNVSACFYTNQITTLLGPNGAAKTTTIKIICGLLPPTTGHIYLNGEELGAMHNILGMCPQYNTLFNYMTVKDHMEFYGAIKSDLTKAQISAEITELLKEIDLLHARDVPVKNLSYGMKRRLCVALAFVGGSKIIILDEPTSGVDPNARKHIWNLITRNREGRTILLTTHHLDEADFLSDRIAVMHQGKLICYGSPSFIKWSVGGNYRLTVIKKDQALVPEDSSKRIENDIQTGTEDGDLVILDFIKSLCPKAALTEKVGLDLTFQLPKDPSEILIPLDQCFRQLDQSMEKLGIATYGLSDTSLEEVFLTLTKSSDEISSSDTESQIIHPSTNENSSQSSLITRERKRGASLILAQIGALLLKRFHHYLRNWRIIMSAVLLPILFFGITLAFASVRFNSQDPRELILDPSLYGPKTYSFFQDIAKNDMSRRFIQELANNDIGYGTACMKTGPQNKFKNPQCVGDSPWQNYSRQAYFPSCINAHQVLSEIPLKYTVSEKPIQADNYIQQTDFRLPLYLMTTFSDYFGKRYGGWSFEASADSNPTIPYAWFTSKGYHAMPSYFNSLTNAILRSQLPDGEDPDEYGITTTTHPLRLNRPALTTKTLQGDATDAGLSVVLVVAFSLIPCSFILYIINEKVMKERQLQSISGIGVVTYWTVALIWDMTIYCFTLGLAVVLVIIFKIDSFYIKDNLGGFVVIVFLYGWANIPLLYCLSRFFTRGSTAYLVTFCFNVFLVTATIISLFILLLYRDIDDARAAYDVLKYLFLIFPQYALGQGLMDMSTNTYVYKLIMRYNDVKYESPFSAHILGWKILALAVEGCIFIVLNLVLDAFNSPRLSLPKENKVSGKPEDGDVVTEKERILSGSANDLLIVNDLSKVYRRNWKKFLAVNHISFGVREGE
ncbi:ATP-binding cassette sub- A member 1, partial [Bulinus truncatus]